MTTFRSRPLLPAVIEAITNANLNLVATAAVTPGEA